MGFIKEIATEVVKGIVEDAAVSAFDGAKKGIKKAGDAVTGAFDKTFGDKNTRHYKKEEKYLSQKLDSTCLFIQKKSIRKDNFCIYDRDQNVKYYVQGKKSSDKGKVNLLLLNEYSMPVGTVKKTFISYRKPLFHESNPADYAIEIGGRLVATLKTKLSATQENYEIEPYGWIVKGSILKWDFTVKDREYEIVHISKRKGYDDPTYILDFPYKQHELIGLLIVLAIICRE